MSCPYFSEDFIPACNAYTDGLRLPNIAEQKIVCLTSKFRECLIYKQKKEEIKKAFCITNTEPSEKVLQKIENV